MLFYIVYTSIIERYQALNGNESPFVAKLFTPGLAR